jgi:dihydropteroate synthase
MKELKKYPDSGTPRDRDALTLLYSQKLAKQGVDILRVHDFSTHMKAFV